jgi:putative ABC transport system substrate-binding protein
MTRRRFIAGLGSTIATALWPLRLHAQPAGKPRRVWVLMLYGESDPEGQRRANALREGLESRGWTPGRNIELSYRWGTFDANWTAAVTTELQGLQPDIIVVNTSVGLRAIEKAAAATPIIFIGVSEPVAQGFVASLARPGGNITGFSNLEATLGAKWFDLLKEAAPQTRRIAFVYNPGNPGSSVTLSSAQAAAGNGGVELFDSPVSDLFAIEAVLTRLGREPGGGLILPPDPFVIAHRKRIVELATSAKIPIVSATRPFVDEGGLLAYGANIPSLFRQAADYVDRILRGQKPADMPVQQPTKFEMIVNLKGARAIDITLPATLLARADEVIE